MCICVSVHMCLYICIYTENTPAHTPAHRCVSLPSASPCYGMDRRGDDPRCEMNRRERWTGRRDARERGTQRKEGLFVGKQITRFAWCIISIEECGWQAICDLFNINVYIHTYIHIYLYMYIHIYMHICTFTHIYICIYGYIYIFVHTHPNRGSAVSSVRNTPSLVDAALVCLCVLNGLRAFARWVEIHVLQTHLYVCICTYLLHLPSKSPLSFSLTQTHSLLLPHASSLVSLSVTYTCMHTPADGLQRRRSKALYEFSSIK